ncbi:recombinase RarA, partial [Staphylococcus epidermidis]
RLTKPKQDFLLPHLEDGHIILIGATTENPYISINPAIRSRTQIFEVHPLNEDDIIQAINRAITDKDDGLGELPLQINDDAMH